jgi:hypothetical protein
MKLLVRIVCTFYVLISCSGNQSIRYLTDLEQANIKGKVTKLVTRTYNIDSVRKVSELESETIEIFDINGYTITDTARNFIDSNEVVNFLNYNKNGSLSSSSTFENGKKQSKMLLKYGGDKCVAIEIYDSNDKLESYYDNISQTEHGLLSSLNSYDTTGKLTMSYINEYDGIYQINAIAKDSKRVLKSTVKIHLNDRKDQENTLEVSYFKDSTVQKYLFYRYEVFDTAGNWIEQKVFNEKGKAIKISKRIFQYRE